VLYHGKITHTSWVKAELMKIEGISPDEIVEIPVPPIIETIRWYFEQRGLLYAVDPVNALLFLT
jgi:hypothetical protein